MGVSHPADTIVSYMNKSQVSTVDSAAKALGFKGMWGGLGPRIIMIGTLTALQWFIYDGVKVALRLPPAPTGHAGEPQEEARGAKLIPVKSPPLHSFEARVSSSNLMRRDRKYIYIRKLVKQIGHLAMYYYRFVVAFCIRQQTKNWPNAYERVEN